MRLQRLTPLLFIGLGLFAIILFTDRGNSSESAVSHTSKSSSYNPNPKGMKGIYLTLKSWQPDTHRWTKPLYSFVEEVKTAGTLVIANPIKELSPMEQAAMETWVEQGGFVILMKKDDWPIKQSGYHEEEQTESFWKVYDITKEEAENSVALHPDEGPGKILLLPTISNNQSLKDNPESSIPLIQDILEHGGPIYFDEYHLDLGHHEGLIGPIVKFMETRWGWVILHVVIVFMASLYLVNTITKKEMDVPAIENSMHLITARGLFLESLRAQKFCEQAIDRYNKMLKTKG